MEIQAIKSFYPARPRNSHKGTYGSACIIAGSDKYIGAAALASRAALMSGCGYVKLVTSEKVKLALAAHIPQVIFLGEADLKSQSIAVGMGCGKSNELYTLIKFLLAEYKGTLIIDADGLNSLAEYGKEVLKEKSCKVILTPHAAEFARLTTETAESFAKEFGVIVLLKGADSIITDGVRTEVNTRGTTALAKAGSGDMLAGYICGTAARGIDAFGAACCGAFTLGLAAEISSAEKTDYCATAEDIIKNLHFAVKQLTT